MGGANWHFSTFYTPNSTSTKKSEKHKIYNSIYQVSTTFEEILVKIYIYNAHCQNLYLHWHQNTTNLPFLKGKINVLQNNFQMFLYLKLPSFSTILQLFSSSFLQSTSLKWSNLQSTKTPPSPRLLPCLHRIIENCFGANQSLQQRYSSSYKTNCPFAVT